MRSGRQHFVAFLADVAQWMWRYVTVLALAQAVGVVYLGITVSVDDIEAGRVRVSGPCPSLARTGRPCATCGMTRGVSSVLHGHMGQGLAFNKWSLPFVAGELLLLSIGGIAAARMMLRGRSKRGTCGPPVAR